MTTHSRLFHQLEDALVMLMKLGLAVSTRPVVFAYPEAGLTRVTWATSDEFPDEVNPFQMPLASIPQYQGFLRAGAYNAVLQDGALVQVSYDVRNDEVVGHRLCYCPCPFDLGDWDIGSAGDVLDAVEALTDSLVGGTEELDFLRLQGPVRFDFDSEDRRPLHENSHIHLASSDCRLPVFGAVGIGQFFRFLLRSYYPRVWLEDDRARSWSTEHLGPVLPEEARKDMFMECHNQL